MFPLHKEFIAWGGDWGEEPNEENAAMDGLLLSDRTYTPKYWEAKLACQPIQVHPIDLLHGRFRVKNEYLFKSLDGLRLHWTLLENGTALDQGSLKGEELDAHPQSQGSLDLPYKLPSPLPGAEYRINLFFVLDETRPWAAAGHEVARAQFDLPLAVPPVPALKANDLPSVTITESTETLRASGEGFAIEFDTSSGRLASLVYHGEEMLTTSLHPNYWRSPTDPERGFPLMRQFVPEISMAWRGVGEDWKISEVEVLQSQPSAARLTFQGTVTSRNRNPTTSGQRIDYEVFGNGSVKVSTRFTPAPGTPRTQVVGTTLGLRRGLDNLRWYGRGPWESTADRKSSTFFGEYVARVGEQIARYSRPQDSANMVDTRWAALTNDLGRGLLFAAEGSMYFNAQQHWPAQMAELRHWYQLPESSEVVVRVDAAQEGVQGGNWDVPIRPEKYQLTDQGGPYELTYWIMPLGNGENPMQKSLQRVVTLAQGKE